MRTCHRRRCHIRWRRLKRYGPRCGSGHRHPCRSPGSRRCQATRPSGRGHCCSRRPRRASPRCRRRVCAWR
ncbi:MAG: hypothetical protein FJ271_07985 [Planctomycetes bacterium]|nr:hypothetical protein [Planctomycetota bacterium]